MVPLCLPLPLPPSPSSSSPPALAKVTKFNVERGTPVRLCTMVHREGSNEQLTLVAAAAAGWMYRQCLDANVRWRRAKCVWWQHLAADICLVAARHPAGPIQAQPGPTRVACGSQSVQEGLRPRVITDRFACQYTVRTIGLKSFRPFKVLRVLQLQLLQASLSPNGPALP